MKIQNITANLYLHNNWLAFLVEGGELHIQIMVGVFYNKKEFEEAVKEKELPFDQKTIEILMEYYNHYN